MKRTFALLAALLLAGPSFAQTVIRQSTAIDVAVGPFVDSGDGVTAETSLTISQADVRLKKNGGAWAQKADTNACTHEENGWYECALNTTDTDTVGILVLNVSESGALPVWVRFQVIEEAVYDQQYAASATGATPVSSGGITSSSFASGAIDATAIATDAIGAAELAANSITSSEIADDAIDAGAIAADAIGASEIAANALGAAEIADAAIDDATFATTAGAFNALRVVDQGTAQSATSTTLRLRSAATFADDELIGASIVITGGSTGVGQTRTITDYVSSTDTATVADWTTTPTGTITYRVYGEPPGSGGSVSIAAGGITASSFAAGAIDASAIAADAIGASEIAADAIGASELAANAIGAAEIADGAIDEATFATTAGSFYPLGVVDQGTAQAATSTTLQLRSAATFADDELIGATCVVTGGSAGVGQARTVTDYVSSTDTATVATWTTTPTGTITYKCFSTAAGGGSVSIAAGGITASSFAAGAIDASAIAADAIGASEIAADAIGASEIATDAIGAAEIAASAIGSSELADGGITSAEFASGAITATVIATDAIGAAEIADNAIDAGALATDAITAAKIAADAIGASELAADSITSSELATSAGDELADEIWDEAQSGHVTAGTFGVYLDSAVSGVSTGGVSAADIADAVWDEDATGHQTQGTFGQAIGDPAADTDTIWALANTNLNATVSSRASQTSVDAIDDFVDTEVATVVSQTSASSIRTAVGLASANLDTQLDAIPTNSDLATALAAADDAVLAAIAALNNISATDLRNITIEDQGSGVTLGCALSVIMAYAAGDVSTTGQTSTYEDPSGTETRISGTVASAGNRTATITCPTY